MKVPSTLLLLFGLLTLFWTTGCLPILRTIDLREDPGPKSAPSIIKIQGDVLLPPSTNRIFAKINSKIQDLSTFKAALLLNENQITEKNLGQTGSFIFEEIPAANNYLIKVTSGHITLLHQTGIEVQSGQSLNLLVDFQSTARALIFQEIKKEFTKASIQDIPLEMASSLKTYLEGTLALNYLFFSFPSQSVLDLASVTEAVKASSASVSLFLASKTIELGGISLK